MCWGVTCADDVSARDIQAADVRALPLLVAPVRAVTMASLALMPAWIASYGVRHLHSAVPAGRRAERKIDVAGCAGFASLRSTRTNDSLDADPAALTASFGIATASARALSGVTATCCSFVPPGGPSSMSRGLVLDDHYTDPPACYRSVAYRRHIGNRIRSGNTTLP
jgi:hypothetical protein